LWTGSAGWAAGYYVLLCHQVPEKGCRPGGRRCGLHAYWTQGPGPGHQTSLSVSSILHLSNGGKLLRINQKHCIIIYLSNRFFKGTQLYSVIQIGIEKEI